MVTEALFKWNFVSGEKNLAKQATPNKLTLWHYTYQFPKLHMVSRSESSTSTYIKPLAQAPFIRCVLYIPITLRLKSLVPTERSCNPSISLFPLVLTIMYTIDTRNRNILHCWTSTIIHSNRPLLAIQAPQQSHRTAHSPGQRWLASSVLPRGTSARTSNFLLNSARSMRYFSHSLYDYLISPHIDYDPMGLHCNNSNLKAGKPPSLFKYPTSPPILSLCNFPDTYFYTVYRSYQSTSMKVAKHCLAK